MTPISLGRCPNIAEIRTYYNRPDILNELIQGMQHWHVRYVPGCEKQSWVYTQVPSELQVLLNNTLDTIESHPEHTDYPYFRINYARYKPAHSWDETTLWGHDFVIEKDSTLWQECFEAMLPVMDILESFGVYYWLKYTGHHSLHLVIPAEVFPDTIHGVMFTECYEAIHHRLMVFLNRRANQHYNEHNRHCPPGTNMPYSLNEDTGLVNLPLKREELVSFRPWHTNIHLVQARNFWRKIPEKARGSGVNLLDEVLKPTTQQKRFYTGKSDFLKLNEDNAENVTGRQCVMANLLPKQQAIRQLTNSDVTMRVQAAWSLMVLSQPETIPYLVSALTDKHFDVRWFAAEALALCGPLHVIDTLLTLPPDDMARACVVDFCVRHGVACIPSLIQARLTHYKSPYNSLPFDKALERIGAACIPKLVPIQQHRNPKTRQVALKIQRRISGTETAEEIIALSTRHNRKTIASSMLGWYDDPRLYARTSELCSDMSNDRVRRNCIKSLLWNDHPDKEIILKEALSDPSKKIRSWAKRYLDILAQLSKLK